MTNANLYFFFTESDEINKALVITRTQEVEVLQAKVMKMKKAKAEGKEKLEEGNALLQAKEYEIQTLKRQKGQSPE